jgi:hypothetical protein
MFYLPRGAFPHLQHLFFNGIFGIFEEDDPIAHVAYAMDHGYQPVSLRLELAGYAAALAEEAA